MKLTYHILISAIATVMLLSSCNKDSDGAPDNVIDKDNLIGTWEAVDVQVNGSWINVSTDPSLSMALTFYEIYNNKTDVVYTYGPNWDCWGTYAISGNEIHVLYDGAVYLTCKVQSIENDRAQVSISRGNSTINAVIIKTGKTPITPDKPDTPDTPEG